MSPRLEFSGKRPEEFEKWLIDRMNPDRYEAYVTDTKEVILLPTRSTRPIVYAYFQALTMEHLKEVVDTLTVRGVSIFHIKRFEWSSETTIGAVHTKQVVTKP